MIPVRTVRITLLSSGEIEFREIAFEGVVVPEPALLALLGLSALGLARRAEKRSQV